MSINFNELPEDIRDKFYAVSAKSSDSTVSPADWYEHLVPDTLQDSVTEIRSWMDGNADIGVADRDVSRIISGANGGEYTTDNTFMELSEINRGRGASNITPSELAASQADNLRDTGIIESAITDDTVTSTAASTVAAESSFLGDVAEAAVDGILPTAAAVVAGHQVAKRCDNTADAVGYGALAAGGAALLMCTPIGQLGALGYGSYKLFRFGQKLSRRMSTPAHQQTITVR